MVTSSSEWIGAFDKYKKDSTEVLILQDDPLSYEAEDVAEVVVHGK